MKKRLFLTLISAFIASGIHSSQAAVTITISGNASSTTAIVSFAGSLTLPDLISDSGAAVQLRVPSATDSSAASSLGGALSFGSLTTSPFLIAQLGVSSDVGPLADTATFTITDTSAGGATIVPPTALVNIVYATSGIYNLILDAPTAIPGAVDAGDVLSFSGSFDLSFASGDFSSHFTEGTHTGSYNGQDISVIVIPEPTSSLFLAFGGIGWLVRCRR